MKHLLRLIPVILFLLAALPAQGHGAAPAETSPPGQHSKAKSLLDMDDQELFVPNFVHLLPHPVFGGHGEEPELTTFYDNNLFQAIAAILIVIIFTFVKSSFAGDGRPHGIVRVFRGWCHWLRDEVVYSIMGKEEGRVWAPFFLYLFFFIAFMNLLGMIPIFGRAATASYYVTGTLAATTFFCMLFFGFRKQGVVGFFVNLVPHGLPLPVVVFMAPIELIGLVIKPFALTIRLFANMLGGHMVTYAFLGMIFLFAKMFELDPLLSTLTAIPAVGMSVFINIIESFIALLQAYVFTYLSVIFIHQAMHPAH